MVFELIKLNVPLKTSNWFLGIVCLINIPDSNSLNHTIFHLSSGFCDIFEGLFVRLAIIFHVIGAFIWLFVRLHPHQEKITNK